MSWRTKPSSRALATVFILGVCGGIAVDLVLISRSEPWWTGATLVGIAAGALWCLAYRPRLTLTATTIEVQNPLRSRSYALCGFSGASPGYAGIELERRDGEKVTAWAVQKSNIAGWLRRRTRADLVTDTIETRIRECCQ